MEKAIIYLRVSTKEQNEEIQKEDCINYCNNHNYEVINIFQERVSAWKENIKRPERDKVIDSAHRGEVKHIVVWAFDRWIRQRDTLIDDVETLLNFGCKLHSVKDNWYESINIEGPIGKTIREFMLGLIGSLAQMESQRRSERIYLGKQHSTKKQGAKEKLNDSEKEEVKVLYSNLKNIKVVAEEYNKLHKPHITYGTVYKIIRVKKVPTI